MLEIVSTDGKLLAIFIGATYQSGKTSFLTPDCEPIQIGLGHYGKGAMVVPHSHVGLPANITEFQEFIQVRSGKVIADVFDTNDHFVRSFEMLPGDSLFLLRGGHGFHFVEDTEFLELKQGPYLGREKMKRPLVNASLSLRSEPRTSV